MRLNRRIGLAVLAGLALSLAYPSWLLPGMRAEMGWLAWVALVPLLAAVDGATPRAAAAAGWAGGWTFFASLLYWVAAIREMSPAGIPIWLALAAALGGYWAAWGWLTARAGARGLVLLAAPGWAAVEWLRGELFTGFPWAPLGASQWGQSALFPAARFVGVAGIGLAIATVNVGLHALLRRRAEARWAAGLAVAWLALLGAAGAAGRHGAERAGAAAPVVRIACLQGSFTEDEKWSLPVDTMLRRYESLARDAAVAGATVMVWPETATASLIQAPGLAPFLTRLAAKTRADHIVGALDEPVAGRVFNGAYRFTAHGPGGAYRKAHLVPFGEYVPGWCRRFVPFVGKLTAQVADLTPGPGPELLELSGGARLGVYVCYEAIFPGLGRALVRAGAGVTVNITNDAWYLRTAATYQHALGPIARAVETGRWVARSANTGWSFIADPLGAVRSGPGLFEPGIVVGDARIITEPTVYARCGDAPLLVYGLVMLYLWGRPGSRRRTP